MNTVVGMGNIIHGAVNANISRQEGAVGALNGAGVIGVLDGCVIGARGQDALPFLKAEETHESERNDGKRVPLL